MLQPCRWQLRKSSIGHGWQLHWSWLQLDRCCRQVPFHREQRRFWYQLVSIGGGFSERILSKLSKDSPEYNNKSGNVGLGSKPFVAPGHDESDDSLETNAKSEGIPRTDPVTHKGTEGGTGNIENIDHGSPAKALPQWGVGAENDVNPLGRVD